MSHEVRRFGYVVPVTDEIVADFQALRDATARFMAMTDEERSELSRRVRIDRAYDREAAQPPAELTVANLLDALGWSDEYAAHLMQRYCTCGWGSDGWDYCSHAEDLNLVP